MRQWAVDAFASAPFRGNPACVVEPFDVWPDAARSCSRRWRPRWNAPPGKLTLWNSALATRMAIAERGGSASEMAQWA